MTSENGCFFGRFTQLFRPLHLYQGALSWRRTGDSNYGGDSSAVQPLTKVRDICGSMGAFAALKAGQVLCYGIIWVGVAMSFAWTAMISYAYLSLSPFFFYLPFLTFSEGWWHCNCLGQCWGGLRGLVWSSFQVAGKATEMSRRKGLER